MRPREARDAVQLVGATAASIARTVRRTQEGVTDATYDLVEAVVGPAVAPIRHLQRGLTRGVYAAVDLGLTTATAVVAHGAAARVTAKGSGASPEPPSGDASPADPTPGDAPTAATPPETPSAPRGDAALLDTPRAARWLAAVNGVVGDRLIREGSTLTLSMTLRMGGADVPPTRAALEAAYGTGDRRLAVFVHGVVEDESCWSTRTDRMPPGRPATLPLLLAEFGYQPLVVRYNSGASIAGNGARLAGLLAEVVAAWPGAVEDILLVGHSMGGLVIHVALDLADPSWTPLVSGVITLGSPAEGAPLARMAGTVARSAAMVPQALWLDDVLRHRSQGMEDLANALGPRPAGSPGRRLVVHGSLWPWPLALADRLGDGMVPVPRHLLGAASESSDPSGPGADPSEGRADEIVVLPGLGHQALLNHPRVHDAVSAWLRS